jgi:hypothetical protein
MRVIDLHEFTGKHEGLSDERVIDGVRAHTENDGGHVVQRAASSVRLRVDRDGSSLANFVKLTNENGSLIVEHSGVILNGANIQTTSCDATVLPPVDHIF